MTSDHGQAEAVELLRRLVLTCHRWVQAGSHAPAVLLPDEVAQWDLLIRISRRTVLHGLVGWYFANQPATGAAPPAAKFLIADFHAVRAATSELHRAAQEIAEALAARGVRAAWRKGVVMGARYPDRGCRPFADIDVFVSPDDARAARDVLNDVGYSQEHVDRATRAHLLLTTNALPPFTRGAVMVDVATSLVMAKDDGRGPRRVFAMLLDGAVVRDSLLQFERVGTLLDLVANLHQTHTTLKYVNRRRFRRVISYLDLELEAAAFTDEDWASFERLAADAVLGEAVDFAFGNSARLVGRESRLPARPRAGRLDEVGAWELPEPYVWKVPLLERLLLDDMPPDLPPFHVRAGEP